jgi:hypothetical protein
MGPDGHCRAGAIELHDVRPVGAYLSDELVKLRADRDEMLGWLKTVHNWMQYEYAHEDVEKVWAQLRAKYPSIIGGPLT